MNPKVSICCIAYNHEKYIEKTLQSFLMQKTDFDYEILVHDDASTDQTAEIIRRYEKAYPDIIKPIYQSENQYSKNVEIVYDFNYIRAKGEYVAHSEGDDYWTDPLKLQKQYDFMNAHPHVSACIHPDKMINEEGTKILGYRKLFSYNKFLTVEDAVSLQKRISTNSIFMRNYFSPEYAIPKWYFDADVTDYPLCLYLATKGEIYYMTQVMSAYRVAAKNSWTQRVMTDSDKRRKHVDKMIELLESFDSYTDYRYSNRIQKQIKRNKLGYLMADEYMRKDDPEGFQKQYQVSCYKDKIRYKVYSILPKSVIVHRRLKHSRLSLAFKRKEIFPFDKG